MHFDALAAELGVQTISSNCYLIWQHEIVRCCSDRKPSPKSCNIACVVCLDKELWEVGSEDRLNGCVLPIPSYIVGGILPERLRANLVASHSLRMWAGLLL